MTHIILGCGHVDTWEAGFGCTNAQGVSLCKACTEDTERAHIRDKKHAFLYLSSDQRTIKDWSGQVLAHAQPNHSNTGSSPFKHGHTFGARVWTFRAVDIYGQVWSCRHYPDSGDYVRMTKTKHRNIPVRLCP